MNKFFTTPLGSYVKVFLTAVITMWLAELATGVDMWSMDAKMLKKLSTAGVIAVLPVLLNALNPNDPRYGKGKYGKDIYKS